MTLGIDKRKMVEMLRTMIKIRAFEEKAMELRMQGLLLGGVHLYIGEEAIAAGACADLRKDDYILSTHRGHGHCIAKGADPKYMMAELFGKETGYCKGKGGSMHIADFSIGILGANAIVAAGIPIAAGAALSAKIRGRDTVAMCFFGDGAANQGAFHEGINLAALWKLPVVFVCENNQYAISTGPSMAMSVENVADRADAYGIPGVIIDGNDVLAVYQTVSKAVKRAREGKGPSLIECKTLRIRGHFEGDAQGYRSKEEITKGMAKDPIKRFRERIIKERILSEENIEDMEKAIRSKIEAAVEFAEKSPDPGYEAALKDVYG